MKMKLAKILFATLAVAACVGCNHTEDGGSTPAPGIKVRVEAGTSESDGTRTEFDGTKTTWSSDDEIKVAAFKGGNFLTEAKLSTKSTDVNGTFYGTITESQYQAIPAGSTYDYVAVYPAGAAVSTDGQIASFTIPASYTATPNSLNGKEFDFMVATADNCASIAVSNAVNDYPVFGFKHVLAFLEITLEGNDPIKTVKVTAPATICGKVSVNPKEYTTAPSVSDGSETITVTINGTLEGGDKLYVPVIPGIAHTGKLTVELTCSSGSTHTITKTLNGKTFTRGLVTKVSKVGYELGDESIQMSDVMTYLEGNDGSLNADQLQVSATTNFPTQYSGNGGEGVTFYYRTPADDESVKNAVVSDGSAFVVTPSNENKTFTLKVSALNDIQLVVWAEVNHNGKTQKSNTDSEVYVIGDNVLTTSVYTSFTKYKDRDLENSQNTGANQIDAKTIYNAGYTLNKTNIPSRISVSSVSSSDTGNLTGQSLGKKTLSGSVTIGGITFKREDDVYITGIPYEVNCKNTSYTNAGWTATGTVENWNDYGWQTRKYYWLSRWTNTDISGSLFSPTFYTPAETNVTYTAYMNYFTLGSVGGSATIYSGITTGTTVNIQKSTTVNQKYRNNNDYTACTDNVSIPAGSNNRIYVGDNKPERKNVSENWIVMGSFSIKYR